MNRTLAHLIGWASLTIGAAVMAMIVLVPPWLELHYSQWEQGWMEACAKTQQEQVDAYEQFASALNSNDPVLLQRLAYHHLRLKPHRTTLVSVEDAGAMPLDFHLTAGSAAHEPMVMHPGSDPKASLVEQWLHKPYPIVGIDHPAYEAPDSMVIRLATGPRRLILLALGGMFLICGLLLPGQAPPVAVSGAKEPITPDDGGDDDGEEEFIEAELDEDEEAPLNAYGRQAA